MKWGNFYEGVMYYYVSGAGRIGYSEFDPNISYAAYKGRDIANCSEMRVWNAFIRKGLITC